MSAIGPKRTSLVALHMSAFGGKADIGRTTKWLRAALVGPSPGASINRREQRGAVSGDKLALRLSAAIPLGRMAALGKTLRASGNGRLR